MFDTPEQMVAFLKGQEDPAYTEAMQQIEDGLATCEENPEEILGTVKEMMSQVFAMVKEMLDKVFNDLDANGDGVVDKDELRAKAESEEEYTKLINSDLFKFIDEDGDQRLQRTEVDAFCTKISVRILGDMDNAMTRAQARRA